MMKKIRKLPSSTHTVIIVLAIMWLSIQMIDGRDTYKRFKRWSTTILSKPAEQPECRDDSDCSIYQHTSCAQDKNGRKKCLCADYSPPLTNGVCKKLQKALRTPCQADIECLQGAECTLNESVDSKVKLCYCREEYLEFNNTCTNGCGFAAAGPTAVVLSAALTFWTYN